MHVATQTTPTIDTFPPRLGGYSEGSDAFMFCLDCAVSCPVDFFRRDCCLLLRGERLLLYPAHLVSLRSAISYTSIKSTYSCCRLYLEWPSRSFLLISYARCELCASCILADRSYISLVPTSSRAFLFTHPTTALRIVPPTLFTQGCCCCNILVARVLLRNPLRTIV